MLQILPEKIELKGLKNNLRCEWLLDNEDDFILSLIKRWEYILNALDMVWIGIEVKLVHIILLKLQL